MALAPHRRQAVRRRPASLVSYHRRGQSPERGSWPIRGVGDVGQPAQMTPDVYLSFVLVLSAPGFGVRPSRPALTPLTASLNFLTVVVIRWVTGLVTTRGSGLRGLGGVERRVRGANGIALAARRGRLTPGSSVRGLGAARHCVRGARRPPVGVQHHRCHLGGIAGLRQGTVVQIPAGPRPAPHRQRQRRRPARPAPALSEPVQGRRRRVVRVRREIRPQSAQADRHRIRQHRWAARHPRHPPQSGQRRRPRRGQRGVPRRRTAAGIPRPGARAVPGLPDPAHPDRRRPARQPEARNHFHRS